ncbi:unnamed protein product, partial [Symbiodinium sp. CCMP2456]
MEKEREQSSRLAKDLQAQLAAVSEGAKEKPKADELSRSEDLPEGEKESGASSAELQKQLEELKQTAEAQRQEIEKQKQESSRCIQDLQAQLASYAESAKEKQKADEETSRTKDVTEAEKASGESSAELQKQLE